MIEKRRKENKCIKLWSVKKLILLALIPIIDVVVVVVVVEEEEVKRRRRLTKKGVQHNCPVPIRK